MKVILYILCLANTARNIRLVDGPNSYRGHVEVYLNGEWRAVCDESWSGYDATVACRMLG